MLRIKKDNTLYFEQHISTLCKKTQIIKIPWKKLICAWVLREKKLLNNFILSKLFAAFLFGISVQQFVKENRQNTRASSLSTTQQLIY